MKDQIAHARNWRRDDHRQAFLKTHTNRLLLILSGLASIGYLLIMLSWFEPGQPVLFWILIVTQAFYLWQAIGYYATIWRTTYYHRFSRRYLPPVDIFITVAGEPLEIIEATARAALALDWPQFKVHILNDGLVAGKDNWQQVEHLAARLGINCLTRRQAGGAKAGNINHALGLTNAPFVAVFDADHVPCPDFLRRMMGYFIDSKVGFVQSPQYYQNHNVNSISSVAWEQQELFFGPILRGKNSLNSVFMCGTNMVIRRIALEEAGGMAEDSIAEDFLTSLIIHSAGWHSVYVPKVLAEGLAPEDLLSYSKQQFRWARGSLEVWFRQRYNPLWRRGLSLAQRFQYLYSVSYFFSGFAVCVNAGLPLLFLFSGLTPLNITTMKLAAVFLPYFGLTMYIIQSSTRYSYTFRALAFSLSCWPIYVKAAVTALFNRRAGFAVTSKRQLQGNFIRLAYPHLTYIGLLLLGGVVGWYREGLSAPLVNNLAWGLIYVVIFIPFILAALPTSWLKSPTVKTIPVEEVIK